jgi:hypothetical protein
MEKRGVSFFPRRKVAQIIAVHRRYVEGIELYFILRAALRYDRDERDLSFGCKLVAPVGLWLPSQKAPPSGKRPRHGET